MPRRGPGLGERLDIDLARGVMRREREEVAQDQEIAGKEQPQLASGMILGHQVSGFPGGQPDISKLDSKQETA
jgi:hypothetical protein